MSSRIAHISLPVLLIALLSGCSGSESPPAVVTSGGLTLAASLQPEVGRVGENSIVLGLKTENGTPVSGAEISARVHMHAMGAMPAMGGLASVEPVGQGRYRADFELGMGGTWIVEVQVRAADGARLDANGSLTVGTPGLGLTVRGGTAAGPEAEATAAEHPATVSLDPHRLQRIGVRSAPVRTEAMASSIRTVGRVTYDETTLRDVSLKVGGFVEDLKANAAGILVTRGSTLFTLYSPEVLAAQEEYLQALRSQKAARSSSAPDRADYLVRAAKRRLELWDIAPRDIESISRSGRTQDFVPIRAPASGFVIQKNVVEGSAVSAGALLFRIAPIDRVWIEADVYEGELPLVSVGQAATVTLPNAPEKRLEGSVSYVNPYLENESRTARVRIELPNPDMTLRPDMFVNVSLLGDAKPTLVAPTSAVLHAGEHSYVFLELGAGRFEPREVTLGARRGEEVEIRSGLIEGQRIVVSGTFLIASESRLRAALEGW